MANSSAYKPGALVSARGREWVVLPNTDPDTLLLRPPGGTDAEIVEVSEQVETVRAASYPPPDPAQAGDFQSCRLLRDAVRLGLRASTGPFRSFGHIAVEPRPYQLVPLLMAMRQETTRLLIADDAGIGKTVEAFLIGRELLDRGEIGRIAVLCPPQLAGQWQAEMASKFGLAATLIMPATARRLEDDLLPGQSLFDRYPFTIISLDFVKGDERRSDFARACPEFVIVDEAHTCAASGRRHQRNALIGALAQDKNRHLVLVTATPHSSRDDCFHSLLAFLGEDFGDFNRDRNAKRRLASHFVQRGRGDIRDGQYFPDRKPLEISWRANPKWKKLFDDTLELCRALHAKTKTTERERSCWLASLIMLRAVSSSPAAALQAFENRLVEDAEELAAAAGESVFDADASDDLILSDSLPGANTGDMKATFRELAKEAKELAGKNDPKLAALLKVLAALVNDGYAPVIFCRFIPTANYLAAQLRKMLPEDVAIAAVTGQLEQDQREAAVTSLAACAKRVLIATDCLSEGINLQSGFNAVIHYDLAWNPGRHEQREGRVDRFGQPSREVRVITWYGENNPIDGMILDVLLRKHKKIRESLGHAMPAPVKIEQVLETLIAGMLLRKKQASQSQLLLLPELEDWLETERLRVAADWDKAVEREAARSRSLFRQSSIRPEQALEAASAAAASLGDGSTVREFVLAAWQWLGGSYQARQINGAEIFTVSFDSAARQRHPGPASARRKIPLYVARRQFGIPLPHASGCRKARKLSRPDQP